MVQDERTVLDVNDLNKYYGKFHALKDIDLKVPSKTTVGLLGPNGAGKTTLIKCITNLLDFEGKINIFGSSNKDVLKRRVIGYLAENEGHYSNLTAVEYLKFYSDLYHLDDPREKIIENLHLVGLHDSRDAVIKSYSKGMKRRLSIARTLLPEPNLIILDEPLTGLDPKIKHKIVDIIEKIMTENRSILISSHQLKDIEDICNWLILIEDGEVINCGSIEEIKKRAKSFKEIIFKIEDKSSIDINKLRKIKGVVDLESKNNLLVVRGKEDSHFEKNVLRWMIERDVDFSLKQKGSLDSIYKEVFK